LTKGSEQLLAITFMKLYIYEHIYLMKGGSMVKRINALLPDEMHKALRVKLAEDGANFSDWLRARIAEYVGAKKPKGKGLARGVPAPRKGKGA